MDSRQLPVPGDSGRAPFAQAVAAIVQPLTDLLDEGLVGTAGPDDPDRVVIRRSAHQSLVSAMHAKLHRVLLLELHAATMAGRLAGAEERARWTEFLNLAATAEFRAGLARRYPALFPRVEAAGRLFAGAVRAMADRLDADRSALSRLVGAPLGELRNVHLNAGDTHRGGQAVARLDFAAGTVMYKPRPLGPEAALDAVLAALFPEAPHTDARRPRVPPMLVRDGYGWTAYAEHRFCRDDAETALFYRNLGRWLALMRLVGGIDLHADNIVADGPVPVVVDAETLFTPCPPAASSGCGAAVDAAVQLQRRGVLGSGLLPMRIGALSGVDISGVGRLPGQQPKLSAPAIVGAGTDGARVALVDTDAGRCRNHPVADPTPERHWPDIVAGFRELSARLRRIDAEGGLPGLLRPFHGVEVRRVVRSTRVYVDLARMLWHPASLHDEARAVDRAHAVLRDHAPVAPGAPADRAGIEVEVADLLVGDVPVTMQLVGPAEIEETVGEWRAADLDREARLVELALVGAYRDGVPAAPHWAGSGVRAFRVRQRSRPRSRNARRVTDAQRRALAASLVQELLDGAIRGPDGTVTWLGPVRGDAGWGILPLPADLYSGLGGIVICLAAYQHEARAGRADPVGDLDEILDGALRVLRATEDREGAGRHLGLLGLGGQIWTWYALSRLLPDDALLDRAAARARLVELVTAAGNAGRRPRDVLRGLAGAVVPLLQLAEATADPRWLEVAGAAGHLLAGGPALDTRGFAHGSAGIGWALGRLALSEAGTAEDRARWLALAHETVTAPGAAAAGPVEGRPELPTSWCRGAVGVGLAACDLFTGTGDSRFLAAARAAAEALRGGPGWGPTLCHGDLGAWELLDALRRADPDGPAASLLSDVEERLVDGLVPPATALGPGLLTGQAGAVHTLLRMHPDHELNGPLLLDPGPDVPAARPAR